MARFYLRGLFMASVLWASSQDVAAQEPDLTSARGAIVMVAAKGVDSKTSVPITVQGTGFFISKEGYLVTSKHLRTKLGDVDEGTIVYEVHLGANGDTVVNAAYAWSSPLSDLMVLFASVADRNVQVLQRGTRDLVKLLTTPVYTAGYPEGWMYSVDKGFIKSWGLIAPVPAWETSLTFKDGQSGSPICLADTSVIATVRGNDKDATSIGVIVPVRIIPIEYWDSSGH